MTDPRIAPVEDNLLDFFATGIQQPMFTRHPDRDVVAASSEVAFPLFNPVTGARFAPGTEADRAADVVARMRARGLPFMWWTTPSTSSPGLERALVEAGMAREDVPGMYAALDRPAPAQPAGVELLEVDLARDARPFIATLVAGFGMPEWLADPFARMCAALPAASSLNVLATLDGVPAATGSAWLAGGTVGLYNIATLPAARGRGVGSAVTARLMELGRRRGATAAVLHSSPAGRPVYERLGFVEVCQVPSFVWAPAD